LTDEWGEPQASHCEWGEANVNDEKSESGTGTNSKSQNVESEVVENKKPAQGSKSVKSQQPKSLPLATDEWGQPLPTYDEWGQPQSTSDEWGVEALDSDKAADVPAPEIAKQASTSNALPTADEWGQTQPPTDEWGQTQPPTDEWGQPQSVSDESCESGQDSGKALVEPASGNFSGITANQQSSSDEWGQSQSTYGNNLKSAAQDFPGISSGNTAFSDGSNSYGSPNKASHYQRQTSLGDAQTLEIYGPQDPRSKMEYWSFDKGSNRKNKKKAPAHFDSGRNLQGRYEDIKRDPQATVGGGYANGFNGYHSQAPNGVEFDNRLNDYQFQGPPNNGWVSPSSNSFHQMQQHSDNSYSQNPPMAYNSGALQAPGYYSPDISGYSQSINPGMPVLQPILTATGQIVYLSDKGLVTAAAPESYM
jgi:hypothetical protein